MINKQKVKSSNNVKNVNNTKSVKTNRKNSMWHKSLTIYRDFKHSDCGRSAMNFARTQRELKVSTEDIAESFELEFMEWFKKEKEKSENMDHYQKCDFQENVSKFILADIPAEK